MNEKVQLQIDKASTEHISGMRDDIGVELRTHLESIHHSPIDRELLEHSETPQQKIQLITEVMANTEKDFHESGDTYNLYHIYSESSARLMDASALSEDAIERVNAVEAIIVMDAMFREDDLGRSELIQSLVENGLASETVAAAVKLQERGTITWQGGDGEPIPANLAARNSHSLLSVAINMDIAPDFSRIDTGTTPDPAHISFENTDDAIVACEVVSEDPGLKEKVFSEAVRNIVAEGETGRKRSAHLLALKNVDPKSAHAAAIGIKRKSIFSSSSTFSATADTLAHLVAQDEALAMSLIPMNAAPSSENGLPEYLHEAVQELQARQRDLLTTHINEVASRSSASEESTRLRTEVLLNEFLDPTQILECGSSQTVALLDTNPATLLAIAEQNKNPDLRVVAQNLELYKRLSAETGQSISPAEIVTLVDTVNDDNTEYVTENYAEIAKILDKFENANDSPELMESLLLSPEILQNVQESVATLDKLGLEYKNADSAIVLVMAAGGSLSNAELTKVVEREVKTAEYETRLKKINNELSQGFEDAVATGRTPIDFVNLPFDKCPEMNALLTSCGFSKEEAMSLYEAWSSHRHTQVSESSGEFESSPQIRADIIKNKLRVMQEHIESYGQESVQRAFRLFGFKHFDRYSINEVRDQLADWDNPFVAFDEIAISSVDDHNNAIAYNKWANNPNPAGDRKRVTFEVGTITEAYRAIAKFGIRSKKHKLDLDSLKTVVVLGHGHPTGIDLGEKNSINLQDAVETNTGEKMTNLALNSKSLQRYLGSKYESVLVACSTAGVSQHETGRNIATELAKLSGRPLHANKLTVHGEPKREENGTYTWQDQSKISAGGVTLTPKKTRLGRKVTVRSS